MISSPLSRVLSSLLVLGLLAAPALASTTSGTVEDTWTHESCFAGTDGSCSTGAVADQGGAFSGSVELNSPNSPVERALRYSNALARHTIGFDLDAPAREAVITVTLRIDEARSSWTHDHPEIFDGNENETSGAKVLFQLLGHEAPSDCGCGWPGQSSPDLVAVSVSEPQRANLLFNSELKVTMTARNPFGDNLLPAGHYEVFLRSYALANLRDGDWGTLSASMDGEIRDVTVSVPSVESVLTLSVNGSGANRVLSAVLTDVDSTPIEGRTISFFGEGEALGSAVTDESGRATLPVEGKWRGGSRSFSAEFAGDDTYEAATAEARS